MLKLFNKKPKIRVRIAPSPTGFLHIGTARAALFNWLFAKHNKGKFLIRIEDTDLERSEKKFEENIISGLKWLGIESDEKIIRQTERLNVYEKYLKKLLKKGEAYYCSCSKEELEQERQRAIQKGLPLLYSGKCRDCKVPAEKAQVIRFKMPNKTIFFQDIIRGEISFDLSLTGDIVIAKDLKTPLYNFAVVIDDQEMEISHIIRGEDHIANTPKQITIQEALGFKTPKYAHLPLILDPDRSKMSKRYSADSMDTYRMLGYLPEAMVNFIALLGWHPKDDKEIMSIEELIREFELERVQKAGAIFNIEKLDWLNSQYIKNTDNKKIKRILIEIFGDAALKEKITDKLINLSKERMSKLSDFRKINDFVFDFIQYPSDLLIWKNASKEQIKNNLKNVFEILKTASDFRKESLEKLIMPMAEKQGRGETLWPLRVALSGKDKSPGPFEIMDILGKEESLARIEKGIEKLEI